MFLVLATGVGFGIVRGVGGGHRSAPGGGRLPFAAPSAFAGHGKLAFVSRGRLYVLDGDERRLSAVAGARDASAPRFSPDGRFLSYLALRDRVGIARADGTKPHILKGGAAWLPNGDLVVGPWIDRLRADGGLGRVGRAPAGLVAWAPDGSRYVFVHRRVRFRRHGSFRGVEQLAVASTLNGRRTVWYTGPISFTRRDGFRGNALNGIVVLPRRRGILVWLDPQQSASLAADGMAVYELRSAGAPLVKLGVTVGEPVSVDANGARVAIAGGGNRYAWLTKSVETCSAATGSCTSVPAPAGRLTLEPAWSPDGRTVSLSRSRLGRLSGLVPVLFACDSARG